MMSERPLLGKTVLVTRARKQASELVIQIEELGGKVVEFPVIEIIPPKNFEPMDKAIEDIHDFEWIVFTSGNGVDCFCERLTELKGDCDLFKAKVAVVGPKTAEALRKRLKEPDLMAEDYKAEGLLAALPQVLKGNERILFPRSSLARPLLVSELSRIGYQVTEVDAYDTVTSVDKASVAFEALQNKSIDYITFTSSSTVRNFCDAIPKESLEEWLQGIGIVCIGPITAQTAANYQLSVSAVAEEHTINGLIKALIEINI